MMRTTLETYTDDELIASLRALVSDERRRALGGRSDDAANVRLLCRAHNGLEDGASRSTCPSPSGSPTAG